MIHQICKTELCTGCAACANICPQAAISLLADKKGFLRPIIDIDKCIDCGLCQKSCAQNSRTTPTQEGKILAALAINDEIRAQSSSGGIFTVLAENVIRNGGVVFGAALLEDLSVHHIMVNYLGNLSLLRGSKYVQSEIGDCYKQVKTCLDKGKKVLFSGTPCQVDALKLFLGKQYDALLTVDILCHGVPSQKVLQKFIVSRETAMGKKAKSIVFREKDPGWRSFSTVIQFEDGTKEIDNSYFYFFVQNYCLRESCSQCLYSSVKRVGDITLGDFWGYEESPPEHIEDDDLGISFVSVNTRKGERALHAVKDKFDYAMRSKEAAQKGNPVLQYPCKPHEHSAEFWADFQEMNWDALVNKYGVSQEKKRDHLSADARLYYAKPYKQRHARHLIHCAKNMLVNKIKGIK